MKWWLALVVLFSLAACQVGTGTAPTLIPTSAPTPDEVAEMSSSGVTLTLRMPHGWQSVPNEYGILLAEHTELGDDAPDGILVYVFVQGIGELDLEPTPEDNPAFRLLNHVTRAPDDSMRDASISQTTAFTMGAHQAAYYLLSDGHGNKTLVLAMSRESDDKVIVCNVSASRYDAERIRTILPMMLSNLKIDGQPVDMTGLEALPNPLVFPEHAYERDKDDTTREPQPDSTSEG